MIELLVLILIAYVVGSTPTSIIVSKLKYNKDIREHGSGNAGATNIFRTFGWKPALFVTLVDVFKGWLPAYVAGHLNSDSILFNSNPDALMIIAGFAAVLGHTYTVFAGFKGGKGVGTLAGMLIALFPIALPICLLVFIITLIATGMVSLGSMLASSALPVVLFIIEGINPDSQISLTLRIFSLIIPLFIIFTHRSNIKRIMDGTENRFEKARIFKKKSGE
ncbi:MAG: glycerol-3-phosphate 1-O-acyltransferase PlsY [Candidatus Marinimicrobia bacterium]|jgi:glycerol-3-phosphate acyltransferase PlsY|nr:glycerol-3-phosphate 1-O-acyltransferase PlsY [Candidatus Neomarinimicrobiota bacterium]MBT3632071.1 glycerol-3-phosphate 1-O-acyltransferase PlsY [Candidatus Neomarinimicrobiota bacterium]MBT3824657.1 glycerol-3-phosphate 1-O-acyltransferase PlsY [Candidatus Neomarinimicrobiota bacterium]MBT4130169.1 glycerol-3-phosphate 1-O-acyltransferase PlsY [Candidatus Neomarinimicrobiota bacterium]MBT4296919.1 glycerol-3-phosphate 1-O-acyltransferase PlsY [Candidatus Neomarinimicrobiota bacterium]